MNKLILKVIQNAVQSDKQLFPFNQSWQYLHQQYNIGCSHGTKLEITAQDKLELLALVKLETGVDLEQIIVADFATMNREEVLAIAINEKLAGQAVKKNRVTIKVLTGQTLKINDQAYTLPEQGHWDMALADLISTAHNSIMVIENYRCFDRLANIRMNLPRQYADPLIAYRGDNIYSERCVRELIAKLALPVLVMADLDPKGLVIAQSFPGMVGLCAPGLSDIEMMFKDPQKANQNLYKQQLADCQRILSNSPHPVIKQFWQMMKKNQAGLVQEYWLMAENELIAHGLRL